MKRKAEANCRQVLMIAFAGILNHGSQQSPPYRNASLYERLPSITQLLALIATKE
jgi:hypothetical protein